MRRLSTLAVLTTAMMMLGCGAAAGTRAPTVALAPAPSAAPSMNEEQPIALEEASAAPTAAAELSTLPAPPWAEAPLTTDVVPAPILSAWERAENRTQCAPIAPRDLGAGDGARARVAELEGGWAVEFDRRGMPGLSADGETCARCGHGVFGIAGTNLTPEDLVTEDSDAVVPPPSFADGSHLELEAPAEGEQVAAATLTVRGQGCVYQVWSFLGEDHVRQLVSSLRLVEVEPAHAQVASR
jgi:hypothetical protein